MKRITQLSCLLFVSLFIISCSKDDDDKKSEVFSNTMEYDGVTSVINEALIEDYGDNGEGYYNYDFILTGTTTEGAVFYFYVELYSKGIESFKIGTFEYYNNGEETTEELPNYYYTYADFADEDNDEYYQVETGNIKVSGSGTNFSISGDLTLDNGEVVKISYKGEFSIEDETDNEF
ncbi:hypothetical protein QLS71_006160 [Mariniflexile litorale]|uniref:Lipoprotein n=1 Tax=Mariniflexile litorale TaxID=3045158 RepID=A0AAU7EJD7_9FLAO|nr:hypothetical protein [Mariniflexile sp. KMM 9835]MDQ8211162.1 hypothetical protein [Mariniflexile sp. KMM 9835]